MRRRELDEARPEGGAAERSTMTASSVAEGAGAGPAPGDRAPEGGGEKPKAGDAPQVKGIAAPPPPTPQATQTKVPSVGIEAVRPPSVSLPKGGGSLRPLGETFKTNPSTGTGSYAVPIPAPSARGFSPGLTLAYDSGSGNGPFGLGWSLSLGSVTRSTNRRLPTYDDANEGDIFVLSGAEDLVPARRKKGDGSWEADNPADTATHQIVRYRPRREGGFARIERWTALATGEQHWVVRGGDGTTKLYGRSAASRIADPDEPWRVYSWLLDRIEDDRGNVLEIEYKAEDLENVPQPACEEMHRYFGRAKVTANRYPKRIRYGNTVMGNVGTSVFDVVFDYGEHDEDAPTIEPASGAKWPARQDAFSTYRAGFELRTYRLCRRILIFHTFEELVFDTFEELDKKPCLVKSIDLTYSETPAVTLLHTVVATGYIRELGGTYAKQSMPPLEFGFSLPTRTPTELRFDPSTLDDVDVRAIGRTAQWVDLDGEGLPGLLTRQAGGFRYKQNLSGGLFTKGVSIQTEPSIGAEQARIADVDGSGLPTLVRFEGPVAGSFVREDGEWRNFKPFLDVPNVDWSSAKVSQIDLDGDGREDLLVVTPTHYIWYPSLGDEGFGGPRTFPTSEDPELGPAWWPHTGTHLGVFFADMTGDGQADLVQVMPQSVCYWPNLGNGRFGAKVSMAGSPFLGNPLDSFDARRIRFADIDGTGTSDLIYFDRDGAKIFWNQAGNSFAAEPTVVESFPTAEVGASASIVDAFGRGTAQIVWAPANWRGPDDALKAIDVVGGTKPYLMTSVKNHVGLETRVEYTPSTAFYLADRAAEMPWATKLPFPVQVVSRVETYDAVRRHRFVQQSSYHHGAFDPDDREFRGFGRVETIDTEYVEAEEGKGLFNDKPPAVNNERPQPPVRTKTWFHLGIVRYDVKLRAAYAKEQWHASQNRLNGPAFEPAEPSVDEYFEALRAMRGQVLRSEVYGLDGTAADTTPIAVTETRVRVRQVQPARGGSGATSTFGVYLVHNEESASFHYEKDENDPRVGHSITLDVDAYGVVKSEAVVVYGRGAGSTYSEQTARHVVVSQRDVAHFVEQPDAYRLAVPLAERLYELKPNAPPPSGGLYARQAILDALEDAEEKPYEETLAAEEKRLLASAVHRYYDSTSLPNPLAEGAADAMALPYESYALSFTPGLLDVYDGRVDGAMLVAAGYQDRGEEGFWSRSGRQIFDEENFYLPIEVLDAFGRPTELGYDAYALFVTHVKDLLLNTVVAELDYRVLAPRQVTDPNGNRGEVAFDALGRVTAMALRGKVGSSDGDTLTDPTVKYTYALDRWDTLAKPGYVKTEQREEHGSATTRWLVSYAFFDGAGGAALTKIMAEPDTVGGPERWVASGRTVVNNKGNPIKQYEPYFSEDWDWEWEEALAEVGVTPLLTYDAMGRLLQTELPNGTTRRSVFTPWKVEQWDENDTVSDVGNLWYTARQLSAVPAPAEEDRDAADRTWEHGGTFTTVHMDSLGRAFSVVANNGSGGLLETRSVLDVEGQVRGVVDALGRTCMTYAYAVDGQPFYQSSIDSGEKWSLLNGMGTLFRAWDALNNVTRVDVDDLERVTHVWVKKDTATEMLALRVVYGESYPSPEAQNLRGRACLTFDGAGLFEAADYDFKGNVLETTRQLATTYMDEPSWTDVALATTPADALLAAASLLEPETFTKSFEYDAMNRVTSTTMPDLNKILPTYNEAGLLEKVEVWFQASSTQTSFVTNIDYDEKGRRTRIEYGNGTYTEYFYDPLTFRLTRLRTKRSADANRLQDLFYFYDPVGNITSIRDEAYEEVFYDDQQVTPKQDFIYDPIYRLIEATGREHAGVVGDWDDTQRDHRDAPLRNLPHPNNAQALRRYTETYTYDEVGNFREFFHDAGNGSMTWRRYYKYGDGSNSYANNRLHSTSLPGDTQGGSYTATYSHDDSGNMTSMPHLSSIAYTHVDQMRMANLGGGGTAYYTYDAGGERVLKRIERIGTLVEERFYLGGYEVYRKRDNTGLLFERQTLHVMDDARRIAMVETVTVDTDNPSETGRSRVRHQYTNHLDSAMVECDADGQVISYEECHPYGTTAYRSATSSIEVSQRRYRYTGKENDEETGLYYFGARYYPPWLGRWTSADPTGIGGDGPNLYGYCQGNPVSLHDSHGTDSNGIDYSKLPIGAAANAGLIAEIDKQIPGSVSKQGEKFNVAPTPVEFFQDLIVARESYVHPLDPPKASAIKARSGLPARVKSPGQIFSESASAGAAEAFVENGKALLLNAVTFGGYGLYKFGEAGYGGYKKGGVIEGSAQALLVSVGSLPIVPQALQAFEGIEAFNQGDLTRAGRTIGGLAVFGVAAAIGGKIGAGPGAVEGGAVAEVEGGGLTAGTRPPLRFAHGTSPASARSVVAGLDAKAGAAASQGGTALEPGSFFAHEVPLEPGPSEGLQMAYEWGLRHHPKPAIVIGELPGTVAQDLLNSGGLRILELPGAAPGTPPQLVFRPSSFTVVNENVTWIATIQMGKK